MRCGQRYADCGTKAYLFCPLFESRITLFRVPIGCLLWLASPHSLPHRPFLHGKIGKRHWTTAPNKVLNLLGVLLQHNEVEMIEVQEPSDFIRESCSQLLGLAAGRDHLADAKHGLIMTTVTFMHDDRIHTQILNVSLGTSRQWRNDRIAVRWFNCS